MSQSTALTADSYLTRLLRHSQGKLVSIPDAKITAWLQGRRGEAFAWVAEERMPTRKDEEWRFTDLSSLMEQEFRYDGEVQLPHSVEAIPEAIASLVFVNGVFVPQLSAIADLPPGVFVGNLGGLSEKIVPQLSEYLTQQEGERELFTALNTAGFVDAAVVWVDANVRLAAPIQLVFVSANEDEPLLSQPRALVVAREGSSLQLVEQYISKEKFQQHLTNAVSEIWLEDNARLDHTRIQEESENSFHIGSSAVSQGRDSYYAHHGISLGSRLSRHNIDVYLNGEQTDTHLNGLTIVDGDRLSDTHSSIQFRHPHGSSDQLHKCILRDRARAVFNGKVFVPKAAQLTNAAQLNRNLLLSPKARIDTKPQLQITADNVKCSHGATVSQLEADEIFYLRSRGLSEVEARHLLIDSFAAEISDRISIPSIRQKLAALLE